MRSKHDDSKMIWDMITKIYVQMFYGYMSMAAEKIVDHIIDNVMSENRSKFWFGITS